jgi:hypothetical protein
MAIWGIASALKARSENEGSDGMICRFYFLFACFWIETFRLDLLVNECDATRRDDSAFPVIDLLHVRSFCCTILYDLLLPVSKSSYVIWPYRSKKIRPQGAK